MEITHVKTIKLTNADVEKILKDHFNTPHAHVQFQVGYDPSDDGPGHPRLIFNGVVIVEDQLAQRPGPTYR